MRAKKELILIDNEGIGPVSFSDFRLNKTVPLKEKLPVQSIQNETPKSVVKK